MLPPLELDQQCDELAKLLQDCATKHVYRPGAYIFGQEESSQSVHLINSGMVKTVCADSAGGQLITGLRSRGWILGTSTVILGTPHEDSAIAVNTSEIAEVPAGRFLSLLRTSTFLSWYVHTLQSSELADMAEQRLLLRDAGSGGRFTHFLCKLLKATGQNHFAEPVRISIPLKQYEIAQLVAVTPEHLSRLAKEMERRGMIRREKHSITVMNPRELSRSIHFDSPFGAEPARLALASGFGIDSPQ